MKTKKQFVIYLIFTFGVAWMLQAVAIIFQSNINIFNLILSLVMFVPILGTLVSKSNFKGIGWKPKFKGNAKSYLFAWLSPLVFGILGGLLFYAIFPGALGTLEEGLTAMGGAEALEQIIQAGIPMSVLFVITLMQAIIEAPIINTIFAVGEEAGWRGAMYPYLKEKCGVNKGRIIGGIIWGLWHSPIILLAGYEYGFDYIGKPFGFIAFCFITIILGILCDWVYDKSKSIWAPAMFHGCINGCAAIPMMFMNANGSRLRLFGPSYVGLISIIPMAIVVLIICIKAKKKV